MCRPVALDGVIVTLGFPEEQASCARSPSGRRPASRPASARSSAATSASAASSRTSRSRPRPGGDDGFLMAEARRIFGDDLADVVEID